MSGAQIGQDSVSTSMGGGGGGGRPYSKVNPFVFTVQAEPTYNDPSLGEGDFHIPSHFESLHNGNGAAVHEARKQLPMLLTCQHTTAALYDDARAYVSMSGLEVLTVKAPPPHRLSGSVVRKPIDCHQLSPNCHLQL